MTAATRVPETARGAGCEGASATPAGAPTVYPALRHLEGDQPRVPAALRRVILFFRAHLGEGWEIHVRPPLNGWVPDIVLLNPRTGIALFEVLEWSLKWNELSGAHRLPSDFSPLVADYGARFLADEQGQLPAVAQIPLAAGTRSRWWQVRRSALTGATVRAVADLVTFSREDPASYSDVVVLVQSRAHGRNVVRELKGHGFVPSHTFHAEPGRDRAAKQAFALGSPTVKVTTVHSMKGWEARYIVIAAARAATRAERIGLYVALSRLKASDIGAASYMTVVCADPGIEAFGRTWPQFEGPTGTEVRPTDDG